jgi:hypothetical protein
MDKGQRESGELSIPSFASERCRAMTNYLIHTLSSIPPTDDEAREDRALACFVVACGELAMMRSTGHRDAVVEQLTVVARKLVKANAATAKPPVARNQAPLVLNQAEGLAQGLMRGLLRGGATPKGPALQPGQRPVLDITLDPPEIPGGNQQDEATQEEAAQGEIVAAETIQVEATRAEAVQAEAVQAEAVQPETVQAEAVQAEPVRGEAAQAQIAQAEAVQAEVVQAEAVQADAVQAEAVQAETVQAKVVQVETVRVDTVEVETVEDETIEDEAREDQREEALEFGATRTRMGSHAVPWGELEALIKQEVAEIASNH